MMNPAQLTTSPSSMTDAISMIDVICSDVCMYSVSAFDMVDSSPRATIPWLSSFV